MIEVAQLDTDPGRGPPPSAFSAASAERSMGTAAVSDGSA